MLVLNKLWIMNNGLWKAMTFRVDPPKPRGGGIPDGRKRSLIMNYENKNKMSSRTGRSPSERVAKTRRRPDPGSALSLTEEISLPHPFIQIPDTVFATLRPFRDDMWGVFRIFPG